MHDEMLTLFDDCITRLLHLRDRLAATRRVRPGERHALALTAIAVAERFATSATDTLAPPAPSTSAPPAASPPAVSQPAVAAAPIPSAPAPSPAAVAASAAAPPHPVTA